MVYKLYFAYCYGSSSTVYLICAVFGSTECTSMATYSISSYSFLNQINLVSSSASLANYTQTHKWEVLFTLRIIVACLEVIIPTAN